MAESPRVLLAEDDPAIASLLTLALESEGYRVTHVTTAADAATAAQRHGWALFLVDALDVRAHAAPSEALRGLLDQLTREAPVLVLTGHTWATRIEASELGVAAIVPKPFDLDQLFETIHAAIPYPATSGA